MDDNSIEIWEVNNAALLRKFIYLPEKIHEFHSNWLPPLYTDENLFYNPKHNHAFRDAETILFLAFKKDIPIGRIMGIIPTKYNERHKESSARFFNLDCYNELRVCKHLIKAVEDWARSKGTEVLIGPFGFSDKDPQGLQIDGFEHLPVIAAPTNLPYLQVLVEKCGYVKLVDCLVYKLDIPEHIPESYLKINERVLQQGNLKLVHFEKKKDMTPYIVPVLRVVNDIYSDIFGFVKMSEEEMQQLAHRYMPILDHEFCKIVVNEKNDIVAFVVASPDISAGIKNAKGRIYPFGFVKILWSAHITHQLDLFLGGVQHGYRNSGVTSILGVSLFESARKRGLTYIDSHLILETNTAMRAILERWNAHVYKRYRVYKKLL